MFATWNQFDIFDRMFGGLPFHDVKRATYRPSVHKREFAEELRVAKKDEEEKRAA
jgi:hypothetical protein